MSLVFGGDRMSGSWERERRVALLTQSLHRTRELLRSSSVVSRTYDGGEKLKRRVAELEAELAALNT